jgi:hypothetical protein
MKPTFQYKKHIAYFELKIRRYDQFSEDRSEGQQSSQDRMLVQLLIQVYINLSRSMVQVMYMDGKLINSTFHPNK